MDVWYLFSYAYYALLVLFIAVHLFVGACLSVLAGVYGGIYLAQNYEIPLVNEPNQLWDKFWNFMDNYRKREAQNPFKQTVKGIVFKPKLY